MSRPPSMDSPSFRHPAFKMMMNEVVDYGSCCECGSCVLVCPHNVIDYVDSKPKQVAKGTAAFDFCGISEGIGCNVCAQVCPRLYPREFQLADVLFAADQPPHSGASAVIARSSPRARPTRPIRHAIKTAESSRVSSHGACALDTSMEPSCRRPIPTSRVRRFRERSA